MNSDMRAAMRGLLHQLCESVYREMQLRAELRRVTKELKALRPLLPYADSGTEDDQLATRDGRGGARRRPYDRRH